MREVDLCVKGWNWGEATLDGSLLSFMVDSKRAFEVPLKEVSQVSYIYTAEEEEGGRGGREGGREVGRQLKLYIYSPHLPHPMSLCLRVYRVIQPNLKVRNWLTSKARTPPPVCQSHHCSSIFNMYIPLPLLRSCTPLT